MSVEENILRKIEQYCIYQERCHQEVRYKLISLGARGLEVEEAIQHLIEHNFLNELRYSCLYSRSKHNTKKWGKIKIAHELKTKQISSYCINKGLSEIHSEDYYNTAWSLIENKKQTLKDSNPLVIKNKITQYMIYKGYEMNLIQEILKEHNM